MQEIKCLNAGFVQLIDSIGDDETIVNVARVSYGYNTKTVRDTPQLINYLMRKGHLSVFEFVEFIFHIKLPIFVARQLIRHRTASISELSARHSQLREEYYIPAPERIQEQSKTNKQGSSPTVMYDSAWQAQTIDEDCMMMFDRYDARLRQGMSKELARTVLPVGTYTEMYWKIDLRNLFNFLKQRLAPEAQHEIKVYAEAMVQLIKEKIPLSYKAFENYILNTITLSAKEIETIKGKNDKIFSVGEREELNNKLGILGLHQLVTANQIE